jgi:DNA-binding response OmpR family regulator
VNNDTTIQPPRPARERPIILVAEDSHDILSLVRHALTSDGYDVHLARDGHEALEAYVELHPDLMILDVMMPRRNGFEVLRELETRGDRRPEVPVLMLTARTSEEDVMTGFELGVDDYLTKPFIIAELRARVRTLLARSRRRDA